MENIYSFCQIYKYTHTLSQNNTFAKSHTGNHGPHTYYMSQVPQCLVHYEPSRIFMPFRPIQVETIFPKADFPSLSNFPSPIQSSLGCPKQSNTSSYSCWMRKEKLIPQYLTAIQSLYLASSGVLLIPTPNWSLQQPFLCRLPLLLPPGCTCWQPYSSAAKWETLMLWRY